MISLGLEFFFSFFFISGISLYQISLYRVSTICALRQSTNTNLYVYEANFPYYILVVSKLTILFWFAHASLYSGTSL